MTTFANKLKSFAADPAAFRAALVIDADGGPVPFGKSMDDWQRSDFSALDLGWLKVAGRGAEVEHQRAYLERPRGHSKTLDLAVQVLWVLAFSSRQLSGVAAAADRSQARLLRNAIDKLVRLNPWLKDVIDIQHSVVKNVRTGSELETLSSDAPTSYGRTPDFVCIDELTHWQSRDLWDSLVSSAAKRKHCVLIVISNAGFSESWQRQVYDSVRSDAAWYFSRLDGPVASWLDASRLDEQRRLLPDIAFRRLWLNEWSSGSGDALQAEDIEAAVTLPGPSGWERGYRYLAGLDLGISRDHSAFAVVGRHVGYTEELPNEPQPLPDLTSALVDLGFSQAPARYTGPKYVQHPGTHRLKLSHLQAWKPPKKGKVDLQSVENAVLDAHQRFGLDAVLYDPYQAEHMAQRLRRLGVRMLDVPFTGANLQDIASTLIETLTSRIIDIWTDNSLLLELKQLRIVEKSYGFRLDTQRTQNGHGDRGTALALAVLGCKRHVRILPMLNRPLLHEGLCIPPESEALNGFEQSTFFGNLLEHL